VIHDGKGTAAWELQRVRRAQAHPRWRHVRVAVHACGGPDGDGFGQRHLPL